MEEALRRGWEDLIGRSDGPMTFRLIIQPAMAVFFAIRAGLRDAREGQPPFLWAFYANPGRRRKLWLEARNDVGKIFILALVLDAIYQVILHSSVYALELLLTATTLALVPYVIVRGLVTLTRLAFTRLASRRSAPSRADGRPVDQASLSEDPRQEGQKD